MKPTSPLRYDPNVFAKTPKDKPVHADGAQQMTDIERAIQPYVAKARKTYPAAKKRFVAGLPPKYLFSLCDEALGSLSHEVRNFFWSLMRLRTAGSPVTLATHTKQPVGYNFGDKISFPESQVMDWTIVHPDEPKKERRG